MMSTRSGLASTGVPWGMLRKGLGNGQQGIAPQNPTQEPNACIILPYTPWVTSDVPRSCAYEGYE